MTRSVGAFWCVLSLFSLVSGLPVRGAPGPSEAVVAPEGKPAPRAKPAPPQLTPLPGLSVEVYRGFIRVHQAPMTWSPFRGYIGRAGRFPVYARRPPGGNCAEPWYQIGPQAWACSGYLLPRAQEPGELQRLESTWQPGPYLGTQASRANRVPFFANLRSLYRGQALWLRGTLGFTVSSRRELGGRTYLYTNSEGYVAEERLRPYVLTRLRGAPLHAAGTSGGKDALHSLPLVIALRDTALVRPGIARATPEAAVGTRAGSAAEARPGETILSRYQWQPVRTGPGGEPMEVEHQGARHVLLSNGALVRRDEVALARAPAPPPPGLGPDEPWIHVDAVERLVFAMAGPRPVRVMLTSLNRNTPPGVFRVEQKIVFKDMQQRFGDDPFYLEAVPYAVFFKGDFGLHGAYWHDGFGTRLSHGCPNLSLPDARFLFDWIAPRLPPGFLTIYPTNRDRGGVVRVEGRYRHRPWEPPPPKSTRRPGRSRPGRS